jgi:hypothetical protein
MTLMIRIMVALMITLFGLLPIFQLGHAEVFKWVDEKGGIHFTEDPATIPEKYRNKTESRTTEEDSMSIEERLKAKQRDEAKIREKIEDEKNVYRLREQEDRSRRIQKEASEASDTTSMPSPGYIPPDKFIHLTNGMTEAEVLSRFGPPTREVQDEAKTKGKVSGYVDPAGSMSGNIRSKTTVLKRYYYIGDKGKGEKTTIIHFENGRVVRYERI